MNGIGRLAGTEGGHYLFVRTQEQRLSNAGSTAISSVAASPLSLSHTSQSQFVGIGHRLFAERRKQCKLIARFNRMPPKPFLHFGTAKIWDPFGEEWKKIHRDVFPAIRLRESWEGCQVQLSECGQIAERVPSISPATQNRNYGSIKYDFQARRRRLKSRFPCHFSVSPFPGRLRPADLTVTAGPSLLRVFARKKIPFCREIFRVTGVRSALHPYRQSGQRPQPFDADKARTDSKTTRSDCSH